MLTRSVLTALIAASFALSATAQDIPFEMREINPSAGIVPAVALADIDGDKDLDIVAMSNDDIAWYENPAWDRHVLSTTLKNLNVCMALADIDGDGLPELAAGADWQFGNTKDGGTLFFLMRGDDARQPWRSVELMSEPTIHRIRWADTDGDGAPELFVAPLMGRKSKEPDFREAGVRLLQLRPAKDPFSEPWQTETITDAYHIMHNLIPVHTQSGRDAIITASFEGLTLLSQVEGSWKPRPLHPGSPLPWPKSGSSEIKTGQLAKDLPVLATVEPWHGNQVAVYIPSAPGAIETVNNWERNVIEEDFNQGHALGWADFNGNGRDELVAGYREASPTTGKVGLNIYQLDMPAPGKPVAARKQVIDDGGMATEDLAIGDLDGDQRPDIVAVGRSTHNIRIYLNRAK